MGWAPKGASEAGHLTAFAPLPLEICRNKEEAKAPESVSSDEENEDGDFTVYECPGLAPVGASLGGEGAQGLPPIRCLALFLKEGAGQTSGPDPALEQVGETGRATASRGFISLPWGARFPRAVGLP